MIIKSAEFITSASKPSQYPPTVLPEIAFAGRSNVGKSSLINALLNRRHLVKTGSTPGRTQLINFFMVNRAFIFVDLPGYGYAKVPMHLKKNWGPMVETYLSQRKTLKGVVLIIDIRRIPGPEELSLIQWLGHMGIPWVPILTKADKLSKTKQVKQQLFIGKALSIERDELILFSARSNKGKESVWPVLQRLMGFFPPKDAGCPPTEEISAHHT
jgi:GTP-binding protein